jgi:NAD(P)-dependent dehydrogenase (short-subunit alcohol dehydrogenase family)
MNGQRAGDLSFADRAVVVTGAGHGLGRGFALAFAALGASVVVNDIGVDPQTGRHTADLVVDEIGAAGGQAVAHTGPVGGQDTADSLVELAVSRFGRLDALVNNAAVIRQAAVPDTDLEHLDSMLTVNLRGPVLLSRAAFLVMAEQGYGRIVSLSSGAALFGMRGQLAYASAKAGLIGMTNVLAIEGREKGILANVVLPSAATSRGRTEISWTREDRKTLGPRLRPELVTPMVAYLASDSCAVTGRMYSAVAGRYARAFVGVTDGWLTDPDSPVGASDLHSHREVLDDMKSYSVPASLEGEFAVVAAQIRARLAEADHKPQE